MKTVWKFEFLVIDEPQIAKVPYGAQFRDCAMQGNRLCLWAEVDPLQPVVERRFFVHGTGHPIPPTREYRGTAHDTPFVWHIYEGE